MGSLVYWTMIIVLYQTILITVISYVTLSCQLKPERHELHELTLMKLLYLYDPQACSRIYFYNYTEVRDFKQVFSNIVWPLKNHVAASFRSKLKLWLSLHMFWTIFAFGNMIIVEQPCKFYTALLPFTATGAVMLVVDFIQATVFIKDSRYTRTEGELLMYISDVSAVNLTIMDKKYQTLQSSDDISWIALVMAYASSRGIVQWIINYWMIKDNFFEGLGLYRRFNARRALLNAPKTLDV
ncbi:uncharacterized protein LOC128671725 [Plodia interpunctella]|uniref:uncharacterized protein LOC128671725 n=1 Tax=Plodia interpunctella TaxID=58824 RepID=UPI002368BF21|nr:uncharacterized protein LOC128671725 [Plodia interpunctella]